MKKIPIILIIILMSNTLVVHFVYASSSEIKLVGKVIKHAQKKDPVTAKKYLTLQSHAVFDRLYQHDLTHLIPSNIEEVKKQIQAPYTYVWVAQKKNLNSTSILAFKSEDEVLKLDLPETLRVGFGKDWPKRLDLIEQSYLFIKQYYGEDQSREILEKLLVK